MNYRKDASTSGSSFSAGHGDMQLWSGAASVTTADSSLSPSFGALKTLETLDFTANTDYKKDASTSGSSFGASHDDMQLWSSAASMMTADSSLSPAFGDLPTSFNALDAEVQKKTQEEQQRAANMMTHFNDFMDLSPFVVNGDPFYNAHELPPEVPRLIRQSDFERQAEEARLAYNNDPSAPWSSDPRSKYPEPIDHTRFRNGVNIPPPVLGHPIVDGDGTYKTGPPGPLRGWVNTTNAAPPRFMYHNVEEGRRQHHQEQQNDRQIEQNHVKKLDILNKKLQSARSPVDRRTLQRRILQTEEKRDRARARIAAPFDNRMPFTAADHIPSDPDCAPLVSDLAQPHTQQFGDGQNQRVLNCRRCGGQAIISNFAVVQRCHCSGNPTP
ncbi:hypothetical protein Sste5346_004369 [Sporothrix stenoceras]|uniref:Uncharacterized protein n=1 Tax=Sporothrix stenoceras TaxID=5173 RepID=A0ABR3Z916_9PEZI